MSIFNEMYPGLSGNFNEMHVSDTDKPLSEMTAAERQAAELAEMQKALELYGDGILTESGYKSQLESIAEKYAPFRSDPDQLMDENGTLRTDEAALAAAKRLHGL